MQLFFFPHENNIFTHLYSIDHISFDVQHIFTGLLEGELKFALNVVGCLPWYCAIFDQSWQGNKHILSLCHLIPKQTKLLFKEWFQQTYLILKMEQRCFINLRVFFLYWLHTEMTIISKLICHNKLNDHNNLTLTVFGIGKSSFCFFILTTEFY